MTSRAGVVSAIVASLLASAPFACQKAPPPTPPPARAWQLLASELPSALLSVSGRAANDIFTVGADKGAGPEVLHFDGAKWTELHTGQRGDLWWVQALANGPVFMAGANGTVLRYDGRRFERLPMPGLENDTVYGVWAADANDVYAVGSVAGRNGFIAHSHGGAFAIEAIPAEVPRVAGGEVPAFFKVFGIGDEVWVVGANGTIVHRKGAGPFTVVPTSTKDTLFTVHGTSDHLLAVGGSGNGVLLEGVGGAFHDVSPPAVGLVQGVFATAHGDWASGERGAVYRRASGGDWKPIDHGLVLPTTSSLHSIFVDPSGGVWSAGGNVLTTALDGGMLVHYGDPVPIVVIDDGVPQ